MLIFGLLCYFYKMQFTTFTVKILSNSILLRVRSDLLSTSLKRLCFSM